jgi:hypothetical protein
MSVLNAKILVVFLVLIGTVVLARTSEIRLPANNQGYEPQQPIAYSHRLHAGELAIDCQYCHYGAESSRHAGVPSASVCMNCHRTVTAGLDAVLQERELAKSEGREPGAIVSPKLRKLYDALALGDDLEPTGEVASPIEWVRVHNIPDFVYFDHRVHVARGLACETCHGPVQSMERIRQHSDLSMGWCIQCHRESPRTPGGPAADHVSTDCSACHY